jgi:hypothetical protein
VFDLPEQFLAEKIELKIEIKIIKNINNYLICFILFYLI